MMAVVADAPEDPVLDVTGVPATDILRRCDEVRGRRGSAAPADGGARRSGKTTQWRLVDFGDGTDEEFLHTAHRVWLGRAPREEELATGLAQLRGGASRLHLLVRLALTPEGRRERARPVRGAGLPLLVSVGRGVERAATHPVVGPAVRRVRPDMHRPGHPVLAGPRTRRLLRTAAVAGLAVTARRRWRRLESEVHVLSQEVNVLRQGSGA